MWKSFSIPTWLRDVRRNVSTSDQEIGLPSREGLPEGDGNGIFLPESTTLESKNLEHAYEMLDGVSTIPEAGSSLSSLQRVQMSVGGMTCAACVGTIIRALSDLEGVSEVNVDLLGKAASAMITQSSLVDTLVETVEDIGYECQVVLVEPLRSLRTGANANRKKPRDATGVQDVIDSPRNVSIEVKGMYCRQCPLAIMTALSRFSPRITINKPLTIHTDPILRLTYIPSAPDFTIRTILSAISDARSPSFQASIWHAPSSDELAQRIHQKEQRELLIRLVLAVVIAIPTFIIGIVYMSLVKKGNAGRTFFEENMWAGQASRGEWAMFFLATPVMFYCAMGFHRRSLKELWSLWKPGSRTPIPTRLLRFGSMNLLISLGVSVSYFSSVALLCIAATQSPTIIQDDAVSMTYFDSVVFLTMFLLIGRYLEAFSKHQAASAVSLLGQLRGSEALLLVSKDTMFPTFAETDDDMEKGSLSITDGDISSKNLVPKKVHVDLLDVGDIVRVQPGSTPPADGTIVSGESTNFDESSLTGESREIKKTTGDQVFVGTINKLRSVDVRIDAVGGETMLEKVIDVVRQGQTKRAPIERLADVITSYFVPVVTALAVITWLVWLGLGVGGALPQDAISGSVGGWSVWSLEFAIAVFVIACPCGIGLAAPTALLVGSGLAARSGILARGGGEAFQEASQIDVMVFDKTGTLTEGGEPQVTDAVFPPQEGIMMREETLETVFHLASASSHPLCSALQRYCNSTGSSDIKGRDIDETAGRGMKGICMMKNASSEFTAILGNEAWLEEHGTVLDQRQIALLDGWKREAKSVVLLAVKKSVPSHNGDLEHTAVESRDSKPGFAVVALFAVADALRKEAPSVIAHLQAQGIQTWMISGDNEITAKAVAKSVGIPVQNVIAGVLPQGKAEKIQWLQLTARANKTEQVGWRSVLGRRKKPSERSIVAMVGDGINDAPALTTADVGIAIGSGSDVAISSAKFILVSSNLNSLLTLTDLSRKVFSRIKFNFLWATVYNVIAVPIAAGAIYPAGHVRLSPVWSSLAMALSSTSVVCSSLLLKLYKEPNPIALA